MDYYPCFVDKLDYRAFRFDLHLPCLIIEMDLSGQLRRIRNGKGVSQKDFAVQLGVSQIHYCAIENGRRNVTIELLEKVATATGMQLVITFIDK